MQEALTVTVEITPEIQQQAIDLLRQMDSLTTGANPAAVYIAVVELYKAVTAQGFKLKKL